MHGSRLPPWVAACWPNTPEHQRAIFGPESECVFYWLMGRNGPLKRSNYF